MAKAKLLDPHTLRVVARRFQELGEAFTTRAVSASDESKGRFCLVHARLLRVEASRKERGQRSAATRKGSSRP